jgi:hypothetical protein
MPASLPFPLDAGCCDTAFTVKQKNKANNKDLANILSLIFTLCI